MAKILDMPKLSPTMEEGVLATWHMKEGDSVEVDDLLAEVETDKATMEFRAFDKGTLLKLLVDAGATVKLGQPVAILGNAGEDISSLEAQTAGTGDAPKAKAEEPKAKEPQAEEKKAEEKKEEKPADKPEEKPKAKPAPQTLRPPAARQHSGAHGHRGRPRCAAGQ